MFLWLIRRVLLPKINEKTKQVLQSMLCAISSPWYCFRTLSWVSSKRTRTDSEDAYMNLSQGQNAPGAADNADGLKRAVVPQTFQAPDHVKHIGGFQEYFGEWEYKLWVPHEWSKTCYGQQQPMQYTAGGGAPAAGGGGRASAEAGQGGVGGAGAWAWAAGSVANGSVAGTQHRGGHHHSQAGTARSHHNHLNARSGTGHGMPTHPPASHQGHW